MTALERLAQAAGKATGTGSSASASASAGSYETGTIGGVNAAASSEVNLDFLVTVTVSVVQVTS